MMRKIGLAAFFLLLTLLPCAALAAKARGIDSDEASAHHAAHMASHEGEDTCRVVANYLRVRTQDGRTVIGHIEQADTFVLQDVDGQRAYVVAFLGHGDTLERLQQAAKEVGSYCIETLQIGA